MRTFAAVAALSVLGVATAVGIFAVTRSPQEAMTADLERDLQLASSAQTPRTGVVSAIEQGLNGAPSGEARGQRMVVPTRKRAPIAAPSPTIMDAPASTVSTEAPQPEPSPVTVEPVAVAAAEPQTAVEVTASVPDDSYPTPAGGPSAGTGDEGEVGRGTGSMRRGGIIGTVVGAIIRGASVGHDKCEPGGGRRTGVGGIGGGTLGAIGGILSGGGARPRGTIPGGSMPGGSRRW